MSEGHSDRRRAGLRARAGTAGGGGGAGGLLCAAAWRVDARRRRGGWRGGGGADAGGPPSGALRPAAAPGDPGACCPAAWAGARRSAGGRAGGFLAALPARAPAERPAFHLHARRPPWGSPTGAGPRRTACGICGRPWPFQPGGRRSPCRWQSESRRGSTMRSRTPRGTGRRRSPRPPCPSGACPLTRTAPQCRPRCLATGTAWPAFNKNRRGAACAGARPPAVATRRQGRNKDV